MNGFRTFLASFRFTGSRFDMYYEKVLSPGEGYPTADEARQDIAARDRQMNATTFAAFR